MGSFLECRLVVIRAVFGVSFEWQDYCNRHSDPFKASIEIKALVDTGATKSLLDDKRGQFLRSARPPSCRLAHFIT